MKKCFVIQPFDNGIFDKRYVDIFEPAIKKAGVEAYRVDDDASVRVPIENIEKGIFESEICFAEITTDNPNVWYELGYAFACGKDVVLVCSDEREDKKFPFDIQHRNIITYQTGSKSDFTSLEEKITKKIEAFLKTAGTVQKLQETPVVGTEGLKGHEIALLILIMSNSEDGEGSVSIHMLKREMEKSGFTAIATNVAIRVLVNKKMIETCMEYDDSSDSEYKACKLQEKGISWILDNQDKLEFRITQNSAEDEDIPF